MTLVFGAQIWNGSSWVDLNDHVNYRITGDFREASSVERRRITASSVIVEGEYTVHSVRANVTETVGVWVYGDNQVEVSANLEALEELFSQNTYQLRFVLDDARETWDCFAADYSFVRNQAFAHNGRALFSAQVPRLPATRYEINPSMELSGAGTLTKQVGALSLTQTLSLGSGGFIGFTAILLSSGAHSGAGSLTFLSVPKPTGTLALSGSGTLTGSGVVL